MSANNQVLVKKYKHRWYVFNNIQAESWEDGKGRINRLSIKEADSSHWTKWGALKKAFAIDAEIDDFTMINSEYGVVMDVLHKDQAEVILID